MAKYLVDWAFETTATTGTGTYTLAGAVTNYQTFVARATEEVGAGPWTDTFYYFCTDNAGSWESGHGTLTDAASDTLSRTVISSSNSGAAVSWAAGSKDIFSWIPGSELANAVVLQQQRDSTATEVSTTSVIPQDDTVPTISEGTDSGMSITITPSNSSNILCFNVSSSVNAASSGNGTLILIFQDSTCVKIIDDSRGGAAVSGWVTAGGTSAQTWTVRIGVLTAGTGYLNSRNGTDLYGDASITHFTVTEIKV